MADIRVRFAFVYSFFLTLLLCYAGTVTAAEVTLTLNAATNDPLSNPYGSGFLDLLLSEALAKNGYKLVRVQLPAERALHDVNSGKLDGEFIRIGGLQKKYPHMLQVPEVVMDLDFVAFSQIELDLGKGWESLMPYHVAFLSGWKIIEHHVPKQAHITRVNRPEQLFLMLRKQRTEVIIYERWEGLNIITSDPGFGNIKMRLPPLASQKMYCYLNEKHRALVEPLVNTIRQMKQDGTYKQYYNQTLYHQLR